MESGNPATRQGMQNLLAKHDICTHGLKLALPRCLGAHIHRLLYNYCHKTRQTQHSNPNRDQTLSTSSPPRRQPYMPRRNIRHQLGSECTAGPSWVTLVIPGSSNAGHWPPKHRKTHPNRQEPQRRQWHQLKDWGDRRAVAVD